MEDCDVAARGGKFWANDLMNLETDELKAYRKQFKDVKESLERTIPSSQRQILSPELKPCKNLGGNWMKLYHLQIRGSRPEAKKNPTGI